MNIKKLLAKCEDAYVEENYERLIELCDEVLDNDLNNHLALGYKARCLNLLEKNDEALKLLERAMALYPDNYHYFHIKAEVLMDKEEYAKAMECFESIFEIGVKDETELQFIRMDYEICNSLRVDQLIEKEKYADAWKCYVLFKSKDVNLDEFIKYVREYTSKVKKRHYNVKISSVEAKAELMDFLGDNGFEIADSSGMVFLIDVVSKTCTACLKTSDVISESKFYDKVNYYPREEIVYRKLFDEDGKLVYEGYSLRYAPYGFGKAYFSDGSLYREGIFDIKGIVQGKEYYHSGQLRFEGQWSLTHGYGPNAPCYGDAYSENGDLIYSGKFEIKRGGVGWPMILKPKGFGCEQKERPKIEYFRGCV